jgi:hypothetical protein
VTCQAVVWRPWPVPAVALTFDVIDGVPCVEGTFQGTTYVVQTLAQVTLGIWFGPGQDLAGFRSSFSAAEPVMFGAEAEALVAGEAASRQTGRVAGGAVATGVVLQPDGTLGHVTSESRDVTHVGVAWIRHGTPVLLRWQVETPERERWRAAEEHFLGSVVLL